MTDEPVRRDGALGRARTGERLGIAFSGGGIRSASFCLGVYQYLDEARIFRRAEYLAGVSGGAYLAAGLAVGHANVSEEQYASDDRPWARGSQEEQYLSRHLSYLAPEGTGRIWLLANLGYGFVLNLLPLLAGAILAGRLLGLLYRLVMPGIGHRGGTDLKFVEYSGYACAGCALLALCAVALRRFRDRRRFANARNELGRHEAVTSWAFMAGITFFALGVVLPLLIVSLSGAFSWVAPPSESESIGWTYRRIVTGLAIVLACVTLGAVAVSWLARNRLPKTRTALAAVAGPAILIVPLLFSAQSEAYLGWRGTRDVLVFTGLGLLLLCFGVAAHNRRYSMHLYYRERLHDAFCLIRNNGKVEPLPYAEPIHLTKIAKRLAKRRAQGAIRFPSLIICAAVAARGKWAPHKARALSFTFDGKRSGTADRWISVKTSRLEAGTWFGGGLTLPSLMAISGAALSPLMGRLTLPAFRFLMAVLNIRLGVWIKNPRGGGGRLGRLDAWAADAAQSEAASPLVQVPARLWLGWREPGPLFVLREGLGRADASGRFLYVSDGGHWENLGVVELIRRRCTYVICVDASGSSLSDLGRAAAIARRDLGVEIVFGSDVLEAQENGVVEEPVAVGQISYPDGGKGQIYVARCALWSQAPTDLLILNRSGSVFPNHPSTKQFLSGEEFEAYRALGWAVGKRLVEKAGLPPEQFDGPGKAVILGHGKKATIT